MILRSLLLALGLWLGLAPARAAAPDQDALLSCSFHRCSLHSPCAVGTCNNGYCCALTAKMKGRKRSPAANALDMLWQNDWAEPRDSPNEAQAPDTSVCLGGFTSSIRCGNYDNCPPGLLCEQGIRYCCPMILPVESSKPVRKPQTHFHHYRHYNSHFQPNTYFNMPVSYGNQQSYNDYGYGGYSQNQRMNRYNNNYYGQHSYNSYRPRSRMWSSYPCAPGENCGGYYNNYGSDYQGGIGGSLGAMSSLGSNSIVENNAEPACPQGVPEGGACGSGGRCGTGYQCSRNNVCCQEVVPATVCPDGTQAAGGCVNGQCGFGFTCNQGLCCKNSSQTPRCLDGTLAIGACMGGTCGDGYACTTGNICCPANTSGCPSGTQSIGPCVNNACPTGFTCVNDEQCCGPPGLLNATAMISCPQHDSSGPCQSDGTCSSPGFQCDITNQWCCPNIAGDPVGPCIRGEGGTRLCPDGYACSGSEAGQCYRLDTGTCAAQDQFGPCSASDPKCPPGYTCIGGFCCNDNAGTYRRRRSVLLS